MQEGPRLCLDLPLGRALGAPWIASWMRLGLLLGLLWGQEGAGADLKPGAFSSGSELSLTLSGSLLGCALRRIKGALTAPSLARLIWEGPWIASWARLGGSVFANSVKNRGALLTAFMGRQGPRALAWGAPLDAPWLAPWIALGPRGRRGGPRAWGLFWERRFAFPNVVGFVPNVVELGTFPNVAS